MYSDGSRNSLAIGPGRDFNAVTDSKLNLAATRLLLATFQYQLRLSIPIGRYSYTPKGCRLLDEGRKLLSHSLINGIYDFEEWDGVGRGRGCYAQPVPMVFSRTTFLRNLCKYTDTEFLLYFALLHGYLTGVLFERIWAGIWVK